MHAGHHSAVAYPACHINNFNPIHQRIGIYREYGTLIGIQRYLKLYLCLLSNKNLQRVNRSIYRYRLGYYPSRPCAINNAIRNKYLFIFRLISFRKQIHQCLDIILVGTYRHIVDITLGKRFIQFHTCSPTNHDGARRTAREEVSIHCSCPVSASLIFISPTGGNSSTRRSYT